MSDIIIQNEDNIVTITFNRQAKKNAITVDMYAKMAAAVTEAESDTSVRAILFKGSEGCFSAGNDLQDFMASGAVGDFHADVPVLRFLKAMINSTVPMVAAVDGLAIGIGTTLLLHCDHVVVSKSAKLRMPFTDLALVPEAASSYLLPKMLGYTRAADLLMGGRALSGVEAHDWGLASHLADDFTASTDSATALATAYNSRPPGAVRKTKKLMKGDMSELMAHYEAEIVDFGAQLQSDECREAIMAFMEGRAPDWAKFG